jgi:hypothetical protein
VVTAADASAPTTTDDARKVLDGWLAAQNDGDFAAYQALYADRFEGIRRSGSQTARLDRARWMKERERMFREKPKVEAKEVAISVVPDGASISFVQSWMTPAYRDEGPKLIVLTRGKDALRISREEMLHSNVIGSGALPPSKFAFAIDAGGPQLVIHTKPDETWSTGAPALVSSGYPVTTRRSVDASKLPADLASWVGKKVELFGKSGLACEGEVSALSVIGRIDPTIETQTRWGGTGPYEADGKVPPKQIALEAWDLGASSGGRILAAAVKPSSGACKGALWGRLASADKPTLVDAVPADAATMAAMLAELQKTKVYTDAQARYQTEKEASDPPRWIDHDPSTKALVFKHPSATIVTLSLVSGTGCGGFSQTLSGAWEKKGATLVPLRDPKEDDLVPQSAGDVDGDGKLDFVYVEGLFRSKGAKVDDPITLGFPSLGCGC